MAGKEVATQQAVAADVLDASLVLDALTGAIDGRKIVFSTEGPGDAAKRIAKADAEAASFDELMGGSLKSSKEFVEIPFRVKTVEWQRGDFQGEGVTGFYAVIHALGAGDKPLTITSGSENIMRRVAKIVVEGWTDRWVMVKRGKPSDNGNIPLNLVDASDFAPFGS